MLLYRYTISVPMVRTRLTWKRTLKGTVSLDTISNSVSYTLTLLAMYPEVQQKIYEEVKRIWPNGSPSMGVPSVCLIRRSHT
jgi:hypothetical protein